jgi:two-component system sensor histidine kinase ArlS
VNSVYPYIEISSGELKFINGDLVIIPKEYLKVSNLDILKSFYKEALSGNNEDLLIGVDPLGFDYIVYQNFCNCGLLFGEMKGALRLNNKKKYPQNKFDRDYLIGRIKEDRKIQNFEEYIPLEVVTQNLHELRNLNAKITASVDEILDYHSDNEWESKFDSSDDNIKKIYVSTRLTKFILDNTKFYMPDYLDSLRPNLERRFSIHKSVTKISKIYSNDFKKRKIKINVEGTTYREILGDKELFEIVLMLLTENAIKYSSDLNSLQPIIKLKETADRFEICVFSFGQLIPEEEAKKLFTKGFRSSVHKLKDGTGMGLHNAKKILQLFNCDLTYSIQSYSSNSSVFVGWNVFSVICSDTLAG